MEAKASESLLNDGIAAEDLEVIYQVDLRYVGQAFQLTVDFTAEELAEKGVDLFREAFDREHTQLFTFALDEGHEMVMMRAIVSAKNDPIPELKTTVSGGDLGSAKLADTQFYYEGAMHDAVIYDRSKLSNDLEVPGPAIVNEMDSTTVILPGYAAKVDSIGNLLINPQEA